MDDNDEELAKEWGVLYVRRLPDKRFLYVAPLTFGRAKICLGDEITVYNAWCYDEPWQALAQVRTWNPDEQDEPVGWMRHPFSGRRRPGGDPTKEYIYF